MENIIKENKLSVYNVGYLGVGKYNVEYRKNNKKCYNTWRRMIERCYSKNYKKRYITYKDCTVYERWHNFQNFAEWFEKNYNSEIMNGWELDKDILVKGSKVYSESTCSFVPKEINYLFTKRQNKRGDYPIGVNFHIKTKKYRASININGNQKHLKLCNTPEEAFETYKTAKEACIKEVAEKWKGLISDKVYEAMYNYEVEIID